MKRSTGVSHADIAFDRPLKPRSDVSLAAFSFLFSEIVRTSMKSDAPNRGASSNHLESELHEMGLPIGEKILELSFYREKGGPKACDNGKRELRIVYMLQFINSTIWK